MLLNRQRLCLAKRFQQLMRQGEPVLGGLEIATILRDEGYSIHDVACTMMEWDDWDNSFAVHLTMTADARTENVMLVSSKVLDPYEWTNAVAPENRHQLNRVEWSQKASV